MAKIGIVGLGMMGSAMVRRLIASGHSVAVWNRTGERSEAARDTGAKVCQTLEMLTADHQVIFSMLSDSDALTQVAGVIRSAARPGTVHVDMSTVSPLATKQCSDASSVAGLSFVHAPVLGSVPQVEEGALLVFAGGDAGAIATARPFLEALSSKIYVSPRPEEATHMKLACNFFIASMIMTLGQGLQFARAAGLDGNILLDVLGRSALAAPMYATKGKNILAENFSPRFFLDHMLKDVRLFRDAAHSLGVEAAYVPLLEDVFARASADGLGRSDYSAVVKML